MISYTDISDSELSNVRAYIIDKDEVRYNIAGDRCLVKFEGATPQILTDLGCTIRNKTEALAYYNLNPSSWYFDDGNY
jgi:hypothetical protein